MRPGLPADQQGGPDPDDLRPEHVAVGLAAELGHPSAEVLPARDDDRIVGAAITLAERPDPVGPDPRIGLLMVHGKNRRS
ncbi:hypothetical protein [Streptomyces meridianus]|uniref:Uncharacterized protein n=1 Tax=Streptomyces meridianus TaxID=2938945 RepID=A0ABT0X3Y5_9ACTN|nr:hypothetical protein [Streptomyces meridianus]MCM2577256.1 hypothetical protein [Streptomyces meridianus]